MRIEIEVNNLSGRRIHKPLFEKVLRRLDILIKDQYPFPADVYEISLAVVTEPEIRRLSRSFRRIDKSTDVLSFSEYPSRNRIFKEKVKKAFLGEVILCYDNIKRYSKSKGGDFESEVAKVFAHGTLHLFGFRHGKTMFSLQEEASEKSKINSK